MIYSLGDFPPEILQLIAFMSGLRVRDVQALRCASRWLRHSLSGPTEDAHMYALDGVAECRRKRRYASIAHLVRERAALGVASEECARGIQTLAAYYDDGARKALRKVPAAAVREIGELHPDFRWGTHRGMEHEVVTGDVSDLRFLLALPLPLPAPAELGELLRKMAGLDRAEMVEIFLALEGGWEADERANAVELGLLAACKAGHLEAARVLAAAGGVTTTDKFATDPMYNALLQGHADIAEVLVEHGGDPRINGARALFYAVGYSRIDSVRFLLSHGVDPTPPLTMACGQRWSSSFSRWSVDVKLDIVRLLLDAGADPNASAHEKSAIEWAADLGRFDVARLLRERGAGPPSCAKVRVSSLARLRAMVELGADPRVDDDAPLRRAARWFELDRGEAPADGSLEFMRVLVEEFGADPAAADSEALASAAGNGRLDIVRLLVDHGADPAADDSRAYQIAARHEKIRFRGPGIAAFLAARGADTSKGPPGFVPASLEGTKG